MQWAYGALTVKEENRRERKRCILAVQTSIGTWINLAGNRTNWTQDNRSTQTWHDAPKTASLQPPFSPPSDQFPVSILDQSSRNVRHVMHCLLIRSVYYTKQ